MPFHFLHKHHQHKLRKAYQSRSTNMCMLALLGDIMQSFLSFSEGLILGLGHFGHLGACLRPASPVILDKRRPSQFASGDTPTKEMQMHLQKAGLVANHMVVAQWFNCFCNKRHTHVMQVLFCWIKRRLHNAKGVPVIALQCHPGPHIELI